MNAHLFTVADEIETAEFGRPHVVILGAGASLAAFPSGDRNNRQLPLIKNFVDVLELNNLLLESGISPPFYNFEAIYSDIATNKNKTSLKQEIEKIVYEYFSKLKLPDEPTLYDHLILSLRPKDVIATFNWDPFLWEAAARNYHFGKVPSLLFYMAMSLSATAQIARLLSADTKAVADAEKQHMHHPFYTP